MPPKKKTTLAPPPKKDYFLSEAEMRDAFEHYPELFNFAKRMYAIMEEANPAARTVLATDREERRLDSLCRLVVGNEICAAVAFDGQKFLLATNKSTKAQTNHTIRLKVSYTTLAGSSIQELRIIPKVTIVIDEKLPGITVVGKELHYNGIAKNHYVRVDRSHGYLAPDIELRATENLQQDFTLTPDQHGTPGLPEINVPVRFHSHFFATSLLGYTPKNWKDVPAVPADIDSDVIPFNTVISVNRFVRATEILLEHLAFIIQATNHPDASLRARALEVVPQNRYRVLMNSLVWETFNWYRKGKQPTIEQIKAMQSLVEALNKDYAEFRGHRLERSAVGAFDTWIASGVAARLVAQCPDFIKDLSDFLRRSKKFFVGLEKLEDFATEEARKRSNFAQVVRQARPSNTKGSLVSLADEDLEEDVHGEMRILGRLRTEKKPIDYIGISKLCCVHCGMVFHQCGHKGFRGTHGKAYPWKLAANLRDDDFLKMLFQDKAGNFFVDYSKFKTEEVALGGQKYNKADFALRLIEALPKFDFSKEENKDYALGTRKLWSPEGDDASESDEEVSGSALLFGAHHMETIAPVGPSIS